jgi:predicted ArsR family transcriptional regulator
MTTLEAIQAYQAQHGHVPNLQVLADILDVHPNTVRNRVERLIADGKLRKVVRVQEGHYEVIPTSE